MSHATDSITPRINPENFSPTLKSFFQSHPEVLTAVAGAQWAPSSSNWEKVDSLLTRREELGDSATLLLLASHVGKERAEKLFAFLAEIELDREVSDIEETYGRGRSR